MSTDPTKMRKGLEVAIKRVAPRGVIGQSPKIVCTAAEAMASAVAGEAVEGTKLALLEGKVWIKSIRALVRTKEVAQHQKSILTGEADIALLAVHATSGTADTDRFVVLEVAFDGAAARS